MKERISILLVNFNRLEYLKGTIETIYANTCNPYELLIWDNASTEKGIKEYLQEIARKKENYTRVFYSSQNIGVWKASNALIARANCPEKNGFVKLDNDVKILTKGWLDKWIKCCEDNSDIGMIGANIEGKKERSKDTEALILNGHPLLSLTEEGTGGAVYVPGRTFLRHGYYNEEYGIYGQGDKDYARRVMTDGKKFAYHREVLFGRFAVNDDDMVGGYREHKNLYVRRNKKLYVLNRHLYQKGLKGLGIWYKKYPAPKEVQNAPGFQWTDTTPKINPETGRINDWVREQIEKHGLVGVKK
jgi:glycosyltransferase involved in cell wall biosynthesis